MNARRVGRLLSRALVAAETNSTRTATQLAAELPQHTINVSKASLWRRSVGPWQQWRCAHLHQLVHQARGCATTSAPQQAQQMDPENAELAEKNIGEAIIKLEAEAMELAAEGEPQKASEMLDEAFEMVANTSNLGPTSVQAASLFMAHISVLQRVGLFEKLVEVCDEKLPYMQDVPDSDMLRALCVLRLAAAHIALGNLELARESLDTVGGLLEAASEVDENSIPAFLVPEYQFYCAMMNLVIARTAADVKALENHMLSAVSGIANAVPKELGANFPYLVAALQAHSKVVHHAIENNVPLDITHALFAQCRMLQRAAGCGQDDLSLIDYQYGTWVYAEGDDMQHARDLLDDSLQELQAAYKEAKGGEAREQIPGTNALVAEAPENPDGDATMQDVNWEHQAALRRFRTAVIDTIMVVSKAKVSDAELSRSTQGTLSTIAAAYEDLLGEENAISAEARFCLSLWGVHEGILENAGDGYADKMQQLKDNMLKCLVNMSTALHGGEGHMLIQKLLEVSEEILPVINLRERLSMALSSKEQSESEASGAGACGHDHSHDAGHSHEHHMHGEHECSVNTLGDAAAQEVEDGSTLGGSKVGLEGGQGQEGKR